MLHPQHWLRNTLVKKNKGLGDQDTNGLGQENKYPFRGPALKSYVWSTFRQVLYDSKNSSRNQNEGKDLGAFIPGPCTEF